jgi:hypothetical protein
VFDEVVTRAPLVMLRSWYGKMHPKFKRILAAAAIFDDEASILFGRNRSAIRISIRDVNCTSTPWFRDKKCPMLLRETRRRDPFQD